MACLQIHVTKLLRLLRILLLIMCSLLSFSHAKSCDSNLDLGDPNLAWKTVTYDRVQQGHLFRTDSGTLLFGTQISTPLKDRRTVSSYKNTSLSKLPGLYLPWGYIRYGGTFRLSFNMSVYYEPDNQTPVTRSLVVAILPAYDFDYSPSPNKPMAIQPDSLLSQSNQMGSCKWPVYGVSTGCIQIPIDSARNSVESFIVYDPLGKRLSVSLGEAARNPEAPYAVASSMALDLSQVVVGKNRIGQIGLFSSIRQLAQLQTWNLTVDTPIPKEGSQKWVIILSSVLGSVAATTVMAATVYCYLNSKYRRWKKDLDQLAKTMQNLPGVPTQVDFAGIRKATNDFHETMKLGRGGFGAVYGCTLPAAASRTGQAMRVAVKKFTRELTDRRYEDFLAEVSIINRLRHKNVVPLVGWSYNKGEPLLIYEYMKNGSLDQHLFQSGGFGQGRRQQDTAIGQWVTRYGIARDIAMGLQYLHHEHEPMVLHRDIKASNIMLDSTFCARLGDFGIACTVDAERSSVTGVAGTIGYMGPEYVVNYKATRQTDIFAFGVVILEIVTGKKNMHVPADDGHITQWVRRLHREGALLQALDDKLIANSETHFVEEAQRLLLLGLACTNPNPSSRPSMTEVLQVINKLAPPPDVSLEQPSLGWILEDWSSVSSSEYSLPATNKEGSSDSKTKLGQSSKEQRPRRPLAEDTSPFISVSEETHRRM